MDKKFLMKDNSFGNHGMFPDIDMKKMQEAIDKDYMIITTQEWIDYNYDYGFNVLVPKQFEGKTIYEMEHPANNEECMCINVYTDAEKESGGRPGEFESSGRRSNVKCSVAYAIPKNFIPFIWNKTNSWEGEEPGSNIVYLKEHTDIIQKHMGEECEGKEVFIGKEGDFTIDPDKWADFVTELKNIKEINGEEYTAYFC